MSPHRTVAERRAEGRARRKLVPRSAHAAWDPAADRFDPVALVEAADEDRLPWLVPVRHSRMATSAFAFYRGTADVMAADLATTATSGLTAQLSGDAHLANFGFYRSPDRRLVFDLNDFDESLPGPWEWDVKRLATSVLLAGAHAGLGSGVTSRATRATVATYREAMHTFAGARTLEVWYSRIEADDVLARLPADRRKEGRRRTRSWEGRDSLQAARKLGEVVDGERRLRSDPPILVPLREIGSVQDQYTEEELRTIVREALDGYRASLRPSRQALFDRFRLIDFGLKVVGVGSVGTRCWVALLDGRDDDDPLVLQVKEAGPSVLEAHLPRSRWRNCGRRVVEAQQLIQASRNIFLGWTTGREGRHYYVRQLRDGKGGVDAERLTAGGIAPYAELCGHTLARAHARSGDPVAIAAYLGTGDAFDRAVTEFAEAYAAQAVADHAAFVAAIDDGRLSAAAG